MVQPRVNAKDPPHFWELGDGAFEELCCDLLSQERGISRCELFGLRRQKQLGIDLKAWRDGDNGIEVAQCKAQQRFSPAEVRNAGKAFLDNWDYWHSRRVRRFILIVACDLLSRQVHQAIEDQEELFRHNGVSFEAWSNRVLVNKLAPHPDIVARRFTEQADYWVRKICGREMPQYVSEASYGGGLSSVLNGIAGSYSQLAHRVSDSFRSELEAIRDLVRRGKSGEAQRHLLGITADASTWPFLGPPVQALALRMKAGLALEHGDLAAARKVLQELEALPIPEGLGVLKAAIIYREDGPEEALEFVSSQDDLETRKFKAALLIETGEYARANQTLEIVADGGGDAEILHLLATARLCLGEGEEAFSAANAALGLQPTWLSVRITFALVGYFSSLSAVSLPKHPAGWPQPVSWALVRRDDESVERRRRAAAEALKALEEADLDSRETRRLLETLRLACLACDPERREEAESFCQELVRNDRLHVPAIAWALGRGFQIDLSKNREALKQRFNTGRADVNQTIALVACHLRDGLRQQAVKVLEQARSMFEEEGKLDLWLIQEAQLPSGGTYQDQESERSSGLKIAARGPLAMLAAVLDAQERQDFQELGRLTTAAKGEGNWTAFVAACEALARHGQWPLFAAFARELVETISTADAVRMAAFALFNQGRYDECLEILEQTELLFTERKLSADLRRLQVQTLERLGRSPEAIKLAEKIAQEEQVPEHLLDLVDLYWAKGDVPGAAFHARALGARTDLPPEEAIRTAARIASTDREVAGDLFKRALQAGIPDELLAPTIDLGQRLDEWAAVQPFVARVTEVASSSEGGLIRKLSPEEFLDFQSYASQEVVKLKSAYEQGVLPVHFLVRPLNLSLAWLLRALRSRGSESGPELRHPPILLCHGGRGTPSPSELPSTSKEWRLHIDTTALLVADALGILPAVEQLFAPLLVPRRLPVALNHIEDLEELQFRSCASVANSVGPSLEESAHQERIQWIQRLRAHLSRGIDRGTYRLLPESPGFRVYVQSMENDLAPEQLALVELLEIEPAPGNFIWIDDRLATAFLRSPGGLVVGITDLLAALEAYGGITREQRFEKLHQLRSAGARYLHLSSDELLHNLRSTSLEEGLVVETHELRALRRYFASCFADAEMLQRPPVSDVIQNPHGEIWFLESFDRTIQDALLQIFEDENVPQEKCWALADFVWNNFRIEDLPSLLHLKRSEADRLDWLGLQVSILLVRSTLLASERMPEASARGRNFLAWIEQRVILSAQRANPDLASAIARSLKELVIRVEDQVVPSSVPVKAFRAFRGHFVNLMPERIRTLLIADQEVLDFLGDLVEPATGFNGAVFPARKLWDALEAASRGESAQVVTRDRSRHFSVSWSVQATGSFEVFLEEVPEGVRVRLADPILGLVSSDIAESRALLVQYRVWLDHGEPEQSVRIDQIALEPKIWRRIEMVLEAREASSAWYYRDLADTARKPDIDISELLPPSLDSLLRYHRLDRDLAIIDFSAALNQGASNLLIEEGVEEAIRRLGGLPVPLPIYLLEALAELEGQVREGIMQGALGGRGSPLATFHLVRARLYLLGEAPIDSEVFAPLVESLWEPILLSWAKAFITLLRWVDLQFDLRKDAFAVPASLRLTLVWSHAHQLARAFAEVGVEPEGLHRAFGVSAGAGALRPDILHPDFSYLGDVTHPARIEPEALLFHGVLFALDDRLQEGLAASEDDWWLNLTTHEIEGTRAARLPFLRAHRFAGNLLGSFLSWERWQTVSGSVTEAKPWCPATEEFFEEKIRGAFEQLRAEPNSVEPWILLSGILGSLVPPPEAATTLAARLSEFDFLGLHRQAPREATGLLAWAARIAPRLESPAASERIRTQILAAAELTGKGMFTIQESDTDAAAPKEAGMIFLFEASRWASMIKGDPVRSAEQFAGLVEKLVDVLPEISSTIRPAMERLSRSVPLEQAVRLRTLILRLRANG